MRRVDDYFKLYLESVGMQVSLAAVYLVAEFNMGFAVFSSNALWRMALGLVVNKT